MVAIRGATHHAVVVDELQLVVRQDVSPVVDQVQGHLGRGEAGLTPRPTTAHGEQSSNVQLLLTCEGEPRGGGAISMYCPITLIIDNSNKIGFCAVSYLCSSCHLWKDGKVTER